MLGEPAFLLAEDPADPQGEALLAVELDYQFCRPLGSFAVAFAVGYAEKFAPAVDATTLAPASESTGLRLFPIKLLAVYRFDWLAQNHNIPLVPYLKGGFIAEPWWSVKGGKTEIVDGREGVGTRFRVAGTLGIALQIDFFDPRLARDFDTSAGVNHTYLFAEWALTSVNNFADGTARGYGCRPAARECGYSGSIHARGNCHMRHCPACRKVLGTFTAEGLELDGCAGCGGVWFDGGELARAASVEIVQQIVAAAYGVEGECRECGTAIEGRSQVCANCGRPAPRCPPCDRGPLAIAKVQAVRLDVCKQCSGVWFDAGELQTVVGTGLSIEAIQQAASQAVAKPPPEPRRVACSTCATQVRASSALMAAGKPYCFKCAPSGSTVASRTGTSTAPAARVGTEGSGLMGKLSSLFR